MAVGGEYLSIGQLARSAGVGVETIRFYQRRGLLTEPRRVEDRIRRYGIDAVDRVMFVKSAQGLGFSLDDIADLLRLVDGTWRAGDDAREGLPPDPAPADDTAPTRAAVDAGRPTGEEGDVPPAAMGESATEQPPPAVDVAAQIEAWRRRST